MDELEAGVSHDETAEILDRLRKMESEHQSKLHALESKYQSKLHALESRLTEQIRRLESRLAEEIHRTNMAVVESSSRVEAYKWFMGLAVAIAVIGLVEVWIVATLVHSPAP